MRKEFVETSLLELIKSRYQEYPYTYPIYTEFVNNFNEFPNVLIIKNYGTGFGIEPKEISFKDIFEKLTDFHSEIPTFLTQHTSFNHENNEEFLCQVYRATTKNVYYQFCYYETLDSKVRFREVQVYYRFDSIDVFNNFKRVINEIFKPYFTIENSDSKSELNLVVTNPHSGLQSSKILLNLEDFSNLDLHYGIGFEEYYKSLVSMLESSTRGLVIFNGIPGSGKTFLVKNLIKELNQSKKIYYISSEMIENLMKPDFLLFIQDICLCAQEENKNVLLILEDCESLVINRDENNSSSGVSVLLNMSNGVLNDLFNIQTILTFNTDVASVDPALLRSNRLLSRRYFGYLSETQIKEFNDLYSLNIEFEENKITVSDIYAKRNNFMPLLDVQSESPSSKKFGFH